MCHFLSLGLLWDYLETIGKTIDIEKTIDETKMLGRKKSSIWSNPNSGPGLRFRDWFFPKGPWFELSLRLFGDYREDDRYDEDAQMRKVIILVQPELG